MTRILDLQKVESQDTELAATGADSTSSYEGCACSTASWSGCVIETEFIAV